MNVFYGIDIGGTTIKTALIGESGDILCKQSLATQPELGVENMAQRLKQHLDGLLANCNLDYSQVTGVGAGVPAFYDVERGVVVNAINLGWTDVPLAKILGETFERDVAVDNDANLAALGESWRGAGQGHSHILCATVGTGIGGGIVVDHHVYRGSKGMAGEIGHLVVERNRGHHCNCGSIGCLETVASATAIVRQAKQLQEEGILPVSLTFNGAKDVFELANAGNAHALQVVVDAAEWLGYGLALVATALNPDVIVIGGGVSRAGEAWLGHIRTAFHRYCVPMLTEVADLRLATLGNDAGVVGAARLIAQQVNQEKMVG